MTHSREYGLAAIRFATADERLAKVWELRKRGAGILARRKNAVRFGGDWTRTKLSILKNYLDAYTTALKAQPFKLIYIDAFAGTGLIRLSDGDDDSFEAQGFVSGSAELAIDVADKTFDKLIFVEKDPDRCSALRRLRNLHRARDIVIENTDANSYLANFDQDWRSWRGVLFLDPFATEVAWSTIERVATLRALDTWILFPTCAITRMLPRYRRPDDISAALVTRLNTVFGDESWRDLYQKSPQGDLFGPAAEERKRGVEGLLKIYKSKLSSLLGTRFLNKSKTLTNSRNSPLFEFMFFVGNERGIGPAKGIAKHLLRDL